MRALRPQAENNLEYLLRILHLMVTFSSRAYNKNLEIQSGKVAEID